MVKKTTTFLLSMLVCMLVAVPFTSCGDDDDDEPTNTTSSIVGTWVCDYSNDAIEDVYTLVFNKDQTGSITNTWSSRATYKMNFDWSLNQASSGTYVLSVIYTSGDREVDGPFEGGYAQYNRNVWIAGKTLSISTGENTVMLFTRK